jgi:hypothetical protein
MDGVRVCSWTIKKKEIIKRKWAELQPVQVKRYKLLSVNHKRVALTGCLLCLGFVQGFELTKCTYF